MCETGCNCNKCGSKSIAAMLGVKDIERITKNYINANIPLLRGPTGVQGAIGVQGSTGAAGANYIFRGVSVNYPTPTDITSTPLKLVFNTGALIIRYNDTGLGGPFLSTTFSTRVFLPEIGTYRIIVQPRFTMTNNDNVYNSVKINTLIEFNSTSAGDTFITSLDSPQGAIAGNTVVISPSYISSRRTTFTQEYLELNFSATGINLPDNLSMSSLNINVDKIS